MTPDSYTIKEYMLSVGDGHELYVQDWGKQDASTVFLFLHGGPGSGCSDSHKRYFNGQRDRVIFFDQRGAGKSTPSGSLMANTTQHLVNDISRVLDWAAVQQAVLVGGSWGSCLALAYGLAEPSRVSAMVLRGLFTGSKTEIDFMDQGLFRAFYPEVWDTFLERTPAAERKNPIAYHAARALSDDMEAARSSAYAYSELEGSILRLDDRHEPESPDTFNPAGSRIEMHYLANRCFMPDRHLLDNATKLSMPIWLVQGRYDMVCPPMTAYELHQRLPNNELIWTLSGHSGSDRGNADAVAAIVSTLANRDRSI